MQAVRLKAVVDNNRELRLVVPAEVPLGPVEVLLLSEVALTAKPPLAEALRGLGGYRTQRRETLDARLEAERDAWE